MSRAFTCLHGACTENEAAVRGLNTTLLGTYAFCWPDVGVRRERPFKVVMV